MCRLCNSAQSDLKRHLKTHGLQEDEIKKMTNKERVRKPGKKNCKPCPLPECAGLSLYQRLDHHFKKYHKLQPNSGTYKKYIKTKKLNQANDNYCDLRELIDEYSKYLQSPRGLFTNAKNAKQQSYKIKQILLQTNIFNETSLLKEESESVLENWFFKYGEMKNPSSAKTYLWVFYNFIKFLKIKNRKNVSFNSERFGTLKDLILSWIKSMTKQHKKQPIKFSQEICPDDVKKTIKFSHCKNGTRFE